MTDKNNCKSPQMKRDGKVWLSGAHQVVLIIKSGKTWDEYFKEHKPRDKSWIKDGKKLELFEKKHKIEFDYCNEDEGVYFHYVNPSIWQKIKGFLFDR